MEKKLVLCDTNIIIDFYKGKPDVIAELRKIGDKKMMYRLPPLQKIAKPERERILYVMDSLLRDAQISLTQQKLA